VPDPVGPLPLSGIRVLELTAWWAGPSTGHALGCLGADVIKVESVGRPDLMRTTTTHPTDERWWEWSPVFHSVNVNKRGVTLDLTTDEGVDLLERLVATADVLVENSTPRVMDHFGLGWERLHEMNSRLVVARMPAFGLDGPWRDRTGFAQTIECVSGMAWVTGYEDTGPMLPRGVCDPLGGMHAAFACLLALRERERTGVGSLVEAVLVEAALNAAAEQVVEHDASGVVLGREPQDIRHVGDDDRWIAVEGDIEEPVIPAREQVRNPQLQHRRLFEVEDHPVTGAHQVPTLPFRFATVDRWLRRPSPTLGQHNEEVLAEVASPEELAALRARGLIGEVLTP
jgi:crotonobetainyl-CoA:carnitine CoA-transferase CaiB-like acyl-CoA transferase